MRSLLWFMLLVFLGAASVIKPDFKAHQQKIYEAGTGSSPPDDEQLAALPEWKELQFKDLYLGTATRSVSRGSLVSYGFFKHVTVVEPGWWENPGGKKPGEQ